MHRPFFPDKAPVHADVCLDAGLPPELLHGPVTAAGVLFPAGSVHGTGVLDPVIELLQGDCASHTIILHRQQAMFKHQCQPSHACSQWCWLCSTHHQSIGAYQQPSASKIGIAVFDFVAVAEPTLITSKGCNNPDMLGRSDVNCGTVSSCSLL